ncbi:MAG TPA: hypothetical protein VGD83_06950 [Streptosporangiaceae bacterium]
MSVVAIAGTAEARSKARAAAMVVSGGVPVPEPPPDANYWRAPGSLDLGG